MRCYLLVCCLTFSFFSHSDNNNEFKKLIQEALDRQPPLCLGETQWPISTIKDDSLWINAKMEALVDADLAKVRLASNKKEWQLTHLGETEFNKNGDFCYGRMEIKQIEDLIEYGHRTSIIFTYHIENLPSWAMHKSIRVAHTDLDNLIMGIDSARYQTDFTTNSAGSMHIIGEPYQLDLLY